MIRGFFGDLIFAIIARMLCGNHLYFCGLSLDKTRTMVIRGYPPSDSISVVGFYFEGRKTKKRANSQAKFLIGHIKQKKPFLQKPVMEK